MIVNEPWIQSRQAAAAWLALTAPGILLTRTIVLLALIVTPWYTPLVSVAPRVQTVAATLLAAHLLSAGSLVWRPARWPLGLVGSTLLAVDALFSGMLLGADMRAPGLAQGPAQGPALPIVVAVVAISLEAGGPAAVLRCLIAAGAGAGAALWSGMAPLVFLRHSLSFATTLSVETSMGAAAVLEAPTLSFSTLLSVETLFGGTPALDAATRVFPTALSVETFFGRVPAVDPSAPLFAPALAVVLVALCAGLGVSRWRVRRARRAVTALIVAAARVAP